MFPLLTVFTAASVSGGVVKVAMESAKGGKVEEVECDVLLVCVGRRPYTDNLGLEVSLIPVPRPGLIQVPRHDRTWESVLTTGVEYQSTITSELQSTSEPILKSYILLNYFFLLSIYAIGDCIHGPMLAHKAEDEGRFYCYSSIRTFSLHMGEPP